MRFLITFLTLLFSITSVVLANGNAQDAVIEKIENKYKKVNTYYASFRQEQPVTSLDKVQTNVGEIWIKKPGKIRWNYNIPKNAQIISDGNFLWYYYVEEKYALKRDLKEVGSDTNLLSLLSDLSNLQKLYKINIKRTAIEAVKYYLVELIPLDSEDDSVNKQILAVNMDNLLIERIYIYDAFGNKSTIKFSDIKVNNGIKDKVFEFTPPKDVEIQDAP
ncbi:MAG TPA: outer membrane lipoprotein chaperone LolA [Thermodesulfobacteriota bacterium]|nr:outer membrane lipoprotein chaperone LolA [Thermodesulfobacteriota bacterium]